MEEKLVKAVMYICSHCGFEMFDSVEELMKNHNFDGKNLKTLPEFECHGCHCCMIKPTKFQKIPASWLEPF